MPRNRVRSEVGKGVEALRYAQVNLVDNLAGNVTYVAVIGPFETDVDVQEVVVTVGAAPAGTSNLLDVFNGTVAGSVEIVAQVDPDGLTLQVPSSRTVLEAGRRVRAGTPITVQGVFPGDNAAAPANISVRVGYDIPVYDPTAKVTTYGAYDDGQ